MASIVEPCHCGHTTWEACSHKQVINIIISHDISIQFKVLKILHEKCQKLSLIEAILGYLDFPHKQRLKVVQVNFICFFCRGSNSSSGISLFHHKGESVKFGQVRQFPRLLGVITSSIKRYNMFVTLFITVDLEYDML